MWLVCGGERRGHDGEGCMAEGVSIIVLNRGSRRDYDSVFPSCSH